MDVENYLNLYLVSYDLGYGGNWSYLTTAFTREEALAAVEGMYLVCRDYRYLVDVQEVAVRDLPRFCVAI